MTNGVRTVIELMWSCPQSARTWILWALRRGTMSQRVWHILPGVGLGTCRNSSPDHGTIDGTDLFATPCSRSQIPILQLGTLESDLLKVTCSKSQEQGPGGNQTPCKIVTTAPSCSHTHTHIRTHPPTVIHTHTNYCVYANKIVF